MPRERSRSRSPGSDPRSGPHATLLRYGVDEIGEDDYYVRSAEFKAWLADTKRKYLDEISSREARRYFERFIRRWNDGRLPDDYYKGTIRSAAASAGSSSQTRHRWGFTSKPTYTAAEQEQLAMVRDSVDTLTNSSTRGAVEARDAERRVRRRTQEEAEPAPVRDSGWASRSNPGKTGADAQLDREHAADMERVARSQARQRERHERRDEDDSLHGRASGRERMLEKKRERSAAHRDFAERRAADDGIEMDDRDLYDDPKPQHRASRDSTNRGPSRREQQQQQRAQERRAEMDEKVSALRAKDAKNMDMLKALAAERFGS